MGKESGIHAIQWEADRPLRVVWGNEMGRLADALGEDLFSSESLPFDNRLVVVPDTNFKEFLFRRFVSHPLLKMAAGVQVLPLNQAVMEILDRSSGERHRKRIPSFLELSLAIEEKLHAAVAGGMRDDSLLDYLNSGKEKRAALADELARLFSRYGLYGRRFLPDWLERKGWQQFLWKEIFSGDSPWIWPIESLRSARNVLFQGRVVLFGFSWISPAHLDFFSAFNATVYQFSPCALFWEDIVSDRERIATGRHLLKKGVREKVRETINTSMRQQSHPLPGNWGKLGREFLKSLDPFLLVEEEMYSDAEKGHLLGQLQQSVLTLDEQQILHADDSLQLHSAPSKLREVEIVRDVLETLLQKHAEKEDPIRPGEILILCPDIAAYTPCIRMAFAESSLTCVIEGLPQSVTSVAVQAFLQLLQLPGEHYDLCSVEMLLRSPPFMEKWGITFDEIHQLCTWFRQAQIRRGLRGSPNSWEEGIDRLLFGLGVLADGEHDFEHWPLCCIPQSGIDLFNRFLVVFSELKKDLSKLDSQRSVPGWMALLLQLADHYFVLEWEQESFFQQMRSLAHTCRSLESEVWDFRSIMRVVRQLADRPSRRSFSSWPEKLSFAQMGDSGIGTPRILWCLGMDDGVFPRSDHYSSLCAMTQTPSSDYYPRKSDEDRSLFLEMLVKTQDYLIFSYQRLNRQDGKTQGPSLLIGELDQYLKKRGVEEGIWKMDHPAFTYDRIYFSADAKVKKWNRQDYPAAKAYYSPHPEPVPFFQRRALPEKEEKEIKITIDISQLKKLARHPLQFYFNETLKIFLKEEEDTEALEFLIPPVRKSVLRKKALQGALPFLIHTRKAQGKMPRGLFFDASVGELEEEMKDLSQALRGFGISPNQISSVRLCPPLSIPFGDSGVAQITGLLEDVTPKGLLVHADGDLKSLVKLWPTYLIFRCLDPENRLLLLTKKGKTLEIPVQDPKAALGDYIEYCLLAKQTPSPMMPEWAKAILEEGSEGLKNSMAKEASFDDPYLDYLKRRNALFAAEEAYAQWSGILRKVFISLGRIGCDLMP